MSLQLVRLLQLASPALPVGAYTYSQGLEWAVQSGVIRDEASAGRWVADLLEHGIGGYDDERILSNDNDEKTRLALHPEIYNLASEIKNNDQN